MRQCPVSFWLLILALLALAKPALADDVVFNDSFVDESTNSSEIDLTGGFVKAYAVTVTVTDETHDAVVVTSSPAAVTMASATDINATTEVFTSNSHGYSDGQRGQFTTSDTLPDGLTALTDYYIVSSDTNTFQVSLTSGGEAVALGDAGTGNQTFTPNDPVDTVGDLIVADDHGLTNGTVGQFSTETTLPTGISASTDYYVVNATEDTFQISATEGGDALDITGLGSGDQTYTPTALSGTLKLQHSIDKTNWVDVGSSQNVTAAGTLIFSQTDVAADWARLVYTDTAGACSLIARYRVKAYGSD